MEKKWLVCNTACRWYSEIRKYKMALHFIPHQGKYAKMSDPSLLHQTLRHILKNYFVDKICKSDHSNESY